MKNHLLHFWSQYFVNISVWHMDIVDFSDLLCFSAIMHALKLSTANCGWKVGCAGTPHIFLWVYRAHLNVVFLQRNNSKIKAIHLLLSPRIGFYSIHAVRIFAKISSTMISIPKYSNALIFTTLRDIQKYCRCNLYPEKKFEIIKIRVCHKKTVYFCVFYFENFPIKLLPSGSNLM